MHGYKRSARNSAELMALTADLQAASVELELLTGPLSGIYNPGGAAALLFAVLARNAQLDRNYIREKTLEGQQAAAAKGNHGGRGCWTTTVTFARALRVAGTPVPEIAKKLKITSGKSAGKHPSVVSVYRVLTGSDEV